MIDVQIAVVCTAACAGMALGIAELWRQVLKLRDKLSQMNDVACEFQRLCEQKTQQIKTLQAKTNEQEAYVNEIKSIMEYSDAE